MTVKQAIEFISKCKENVEKEYKVPIKDYFEKKVDKDDEEKIFTKFNKYDNVKDIVVPGFSYDGCRYNQVQIKKSDYNALESPWNPPEKALDIENYLDDKDRSHREKVQFEKYK